MSNIFVINLNERKDRWEKIKSTFNFFWLRRVEAIKEKIGWIGCLKSHQLCLQKAKEENLQTCLVLEDDCQLNTDKETFLTNWINIRIWLDNNLNKWDIFYGGCANVKPEHIYEKINDDLDLIRLEYGTSTHFVYYNKSIYDKIINYIPKKNYFPIDVIICEKARGRIITSIPFLAIQKEDCSNLENRVVDYSNLYKESEQTIISVTNGGKLTVSIELLGGLGNRLFQFASSYGIAKKQNKKVEIFEEFIHSNSHSTNNYFDTIFRKINKSKKIPSDKKWNIFREPDCNSYTYYDIPYSHNNIKLLGYFQNENYFFDVEDEIRDIFEIEEERYHKLLKLYPDVKDRFFIHVRRGDYINNPLHYVELSNYYRDIIQYIKNNFDKNSKFYLFSNDINYCSTIEYFQDENINYIVDLDEIDTLYLMSLCERGGIAPNSTFSWWGGWLNKNPNKIVFYPTKWLNNTNLNPNWKGSYYYKIE